MPNLINKVAIITGGAASIGRDISRELHRQGASVVIAARTPEKGEALVKELGERAVYVQTDITDDSQLERLIERTISEFGRLDILVNNACAYDDEGAQTTRETWLSTINVSAISAAILGQMARPHLAKSQGNIVNIGSVSGAFPHIGRWAYPVAKATLRHLSKSQAVEYAQDKIRVNLLVLGHIWSDPFEGLTGDNRAHADKVSASFNLLGRVANGEEVAKLAAFVASEDASYMTGAEVPVDGGYSAMGPEQHMPLMPLLMEGSS
jgi:NAD(P)-dependent dehydrogenase (short-subunit alcohol dehydrogenase family)